MNREKQLEYCKKCTHQKFDFNQGIICGLTSQRANFEGECENFEIDKNKIVAINSKKSDESKKGMSFGFSPKQTDNLEVSDISKKQAFVLAYESAKELKWNIGYFSESGFIAYTKVSMTSWSEEVQVKIEVGNINIKSECTGSQLIDWGKNRKNITSFFKAFKKNKERLSEIDIDEKYAELSKEFVEPDDDIINPPLNKKEQISGFFSLFTPSNGYFITPIIVVLNILIFAAMAISGVHLILPSNESLLLWGSNFRPMTMEGEWWRLFTSTFIHIGIFHLLMNMYALIYIGLLLEPYLGKERFLSAYLIAGISGSVASVFWNEMTISAGASGAIFGMYGVFLALLTTKLIDKSARKSLLISIGIFVFYNLANGMKGGIDNAAHIGGLISGLVIGYSFYPGLKNHKPILKHATVGILIIFFALGSMFALKNIKSDFGKYDKEMQQFLIFEEKALGLYRMPEKSTNSQLLYELQNNGIKNWENCLVILDKVDTYELPEAVEIKNARLKDYCNLRIRSYETIRKAITEETNKYDLEIYQYNTEIEKIISELSK